RRSVRSSAMRRATERRCSGPHTSSTSSASSRIASRCSTAATRSSPARLRSSPHPHAHIATSSRCAHAAAPHSWTPPFSSSAGGAHAPSAGRGDDGEYVLELSTGLPLGELIAGLYRYKCEVVACHEERPALEEALLSLISPEAR